MDNVILWDIKTGQQIRTFNPHRMALTSMGIVISQGDEKFVLSGSNDYRAKLWNLSTGKIVWSQKYGYDVRVATSGNGRRGVISADSDPVLINFDFNR